MQKNLSFLVFLAVVCLAIGCGLVDAVQAAGKQAEVVAHAVVAPVQAKAPEVAPAPPNGCSPDFRILFEQAVVELSGTGEADAVIVTDPLCWHCRLAHKLMKEYPNMYRKLRLSFFPRRGFIGSDMAAWVLEDAAGTERLQTMVNFAYEILKAPKTADLMTARMLVLVQFTQAFPGMLMGTTLEALFERLQSAHEDHVMESVMLARAAQLPGTPVLIAGDKVVLGFGPDQWLKALEEKSICK